MKTALAAACVMDWREVKLGLGKVRSSYWIESEGSIGTPNQCEGKWRDEGLDAKLQKLGLAVLGSHLYVKNRTGKSLECT